ncbi:hypothetical protein FTX61_07670 [Nitriliruptoraceae bacterium ZYF776]|nr:hypothetical protein [Profundirhabdus halotolerans]
MFVLGEVAVGVGLERGEVGVGRFGELGCHLAIVRTVRILAIGVAVAGRVLGVAAVVDGEVERLGLRLAAAGEQQPRERDGRERVTCGATHRHRPPCRMRDRG